MAKYVKQNVQFLKKRESDRNIFPFRSIWLFSHSVPTVPSKGCAICDGIANVSLCTVTQQCPPNQVIYLLHEDNHN